MARTNLVRFFLLKAPIALLVSLVVACGTEVTPAPTPQLTPSPTPTSQLIPTLQPTTSSELTPTLISPEEPEGTTPPYPASPVIETITWHMDTHITAAPGSDIWPVTWAADDNLYLGWGDGGGFGGTNTDGRVSIGFARIEGEPEEFIGVNVSGGVNAVHPASIERGKPSAIISVDGVLYVWLNTQNGTPPDFRLAWSYDFGETWQLSDWAFPKTGDFFPGKFLNAGKDNSATQDEYIYTYGAR
jgi:hypothetical protein